MTQTANAISPNSLEATVLKLCSDAKAASQSLLSLEDSQIDHALKDIAIALRHAESDILSANQHDLKAAKEKGLSDTMTDRLVLNVDRIEGIAKGCENVASLPHPCGRELWESNPENGLKIKRVSVPIGVLGMIYESRPNVTVDAAVLCLKSRNAVILRGGSESLHSSKALHKIIQDVLSDHNINPSVISMIPVSDREAVGMMLRASEFIDVMIPRGGKGLIERVMNEARMPVFGHLEGLCHIYLHHDVDPDMAREVCVNAKLRRTGICGAMETLLLDQNLDQAIAQNIIQTLLDKECEIVGDAPSQGLDPRINPAQGHDWSTEYLSAKLSVKYVDDVDAAIQHINNYGSHHTDSILTQDDAVAAKFQKLVDSGIVMRNASTQFADGGEFGMGAEIGIATGKMHARGPVGLEQLCTYKYLVEGNGNVRP